MHDNYYPSTCISKRFQDRSIWAATEEFAFRVFYESPQRKKEESISTSWNYKSAVNI